MSVARSTIHQTLKIFESDDKLMSEDASPATVTPGKLNSSSSLTNQLELQNVS